ncbi:unnamed protein product [Orchesella dallaii]|uniref:Gustatory receptor n=1 Tax=Orchesella dallaii TaxID=48710 RepID=A0ABP1PJN0_9HEXA
MALFKSTGLLERHAKIYVGLCHLSSYNPFSWDQVTKQINFNEQKWLLKNNKVTYLTYTGILMGMIYEAVVYGVLNNSNDEEKSVIQDWLFRTVFFCLHLVGMIHYAVVEHHGPVLVALLNDIIRKSSGSILNKGVRMALNSFMVSTFVTPVAVVIAILIFYETLPFPSFLTRNNTEDSWIWKGLQIQITLLYVRSFTSWCYIGCIIIFGVILSIGTIWESIHSLELMQKMNTKLTDQFRKYRVIQLIACCTNICFQKTIFLWCTVLIIGIDVVSFTKCLMSAQTLSPTLVVMLVLVSLNFNVMTVCEYRFPGLMNQVSKEIIRGLSTLNYNEEEDTFDGTTLFENRHRSKSGRKETRLRMPSLLLHSQSRINSRITRDAKFHMEPEEDGAKDNFDEQSLSRKATAFSSGSVKDRPYFLDRWTMNRLRQSLILGAFSGTFPRSWNTKEHRIDKWAPQWERLWNFQWGIVTLQTCCVTVYQFYAFYKGIVEGHHETYRELFMSSFSVFWYCICLCFNVTMVFYKDQIREFINTLLKFNQEYMGKHV